MSAPTGLSLRQLQALEAVARTKSFTAAAAEMGVSQPTVSNLVVSAERQTKLKFLHRQGNLITPTEHFETIRPKIRALLELKSEVDLQVSDRSDLRAGPFWVGYSTYQTAMPCIARFIHAHPKVTLNARALASDDLLPLLRNGEIDAAFVTAPEPPEGFHCLQITACRIGIVTPKGGPFGKVDVLSWSDLEDVRLIQREPQAGTRRIFEAAANRADARIQTVLGLGSWGSITTLVREGVGHGIGLDVEMTQTDADLRFVPIDDDHLKTRQYLIAIPTMAQTSSVRLFFDIVREYCTEAE